MALLVWYGCKRILNDQQMHALSANRQMVLHPGVITAFIVLLNMLFSPIRQLADKFNTLQMGMVGADRIFKVLDTDEVATDTGINWARQHCRAILSLTMFGLPITMRTGC
jgi:ATP-binding cassette subfamily B multidrug efflux pump